jgi:transcription elongation GreA/GreB family factor
MSAAEQRELERERRKRIDKEIEDAEQAEKRAQVNPAEVRVAKEFFGSFDNALVVLQKLIGRVEALEAKAAKRKLTFVP